MMRRGMLQRYGIRRTAFLLPLFLCLLYNPSSSSACSCGPYPSVAQAFEEADVVFSGTLIGIHHDYEFVDGLPLPVTTYYSFRVDSIWKGLERVGTKPELTITTPLNMCTSGYYIGERILDYAYDDPAGNLYNFGVCGRRGRLQDVADLDPPMAEFSSYPPSPIEKILGGWDLYNPTEPTSLLHLQFDEESRWGTWKCRDEVCEDAEHGWFGIDGNRLTLQILDSPDPERIGTFLTTEVTFPGQGMVTFSNAMELTRGFSSTEEITVGSPLTAVEDGTWGHIKAGTIDKQNREMR